MKPHRRPLLLLWLVIPLLALSSLLVASKPNPTDAAKPREIKEVFWPKAYREGDVALLDKILANTSLARHS